MLLVAGAGHPGRRETGRGPRRGGGGERDQREDCVKSGWCRLSIGAVSLEEIAALLPRLERALKALLPAGERAGIPGGTR